MRILYISNEYPPETGFGGIGTYTATAARAMAARGHDVRVICRSPDGTTRDLVDAGVRVRRIPGGTHPLPVAPAWYPLRAWARRSAPHLLNRLAWAREARRACRDLVAREGPFDIAEYPECGGEGIGIAGTRDMATIARLHTPWTMVRRFDGIREPLLDRLLVARIERQSVRRSTGVSSPTTALAEILGRQWHVPGIAVYPNPIDLSAYPPAHGSQWLFVGRVERRKGVDVLLKAYARLATRGPVPRLHLVGRPFPEDSPHARDVAAAVDALGEKVVWTRGASPDQVRESLAASSVVIVPSRWENFPYSCLEAMASGCAVVAARVGGLAEIIEHGRTGLLFAPEDDADCEAQLRRLIDEPDLRSRLGVAARRHVTAFDSARVAVRTEQWYTECISRSPARRAHSRRSL